MARPLFNESVGELEAAFLRRRMDRAFLKLLEEELTHRSTERARKLRRAVETALTEFPPNHSSKISPDDTGKRNGDATPARDSEPTPPIETRFQADDEQATADQSINSPSEILSAWIAMEVLSPPAYRRPEQLAVGGDRNSVAALGDDSLPWERGDKSRPNYRLYYQIVLGSIKMERAIALLMEKYGDSRPELQSVQGNAILAVVIVDKQGRLVEAPTIAVSSFGWGMVTALNGQLANLAGWSQVEPELVRTVEKELLRHADGEDEEEKKTVPVTRKALMAAYHALVRRTGLPSDIVEAPAFAIRSYEYFKNPSAPEPLLLNSFFLGDLSLARDLFRRKKAPDNLRRYLGQVAPETRLDLLRDDVALERAIAPALTNLARWPSRGRYPLSILQQAAINISFTETRMSGIVGINGPPGTGKTTLLRDILAGVVTARAQAMCQYDDPEKAFLHSGQKLKAGNGWLHLYKLSSDLRGFEMVVASSNNRAVENVSRELPSMSSIASDADELRYFKILADEVHERDTWGLVAAVLGNAANRARFKQAFWWNGETSMNVYLAAAAGGNPQVSEVDPRTKETVYRSPEIVLAERPPRTHTEALERWKKAQIEFTAALKKSEEWQRWLERVRESLLTLDSLIEAESWAQKKWEGAKVLVECEEEALGSAHNQLSEANAALRSKEQELQEHEAKRPGIWARLFGTKKARLWAVAKRVLGDSTQQCWKQAAEAAHVCKACESSLFEAKQTLRRAQIEVQSAVAARIDAENLLGEAREQFGVVFPDPAFFAQDHDTKHKASAWYPDAAQRLRDDLFVAAFHLHRAFADAAAKPLRHNLGALMNALSGNALPNADKEALLPDLWASLFLVVPLVSTTFASVGKMFGKLGEQSLGWLLIDEAGQALPQAAVGAILRSRRAIVVGDPVQIEPVVVLPDTLTQAIARSFAVDADLYAAPIASVQTLADSASSYGSEFETASGSRRVGVPLLVHRRCEDPMFRIANAIAYSGLMVQAKAKNASHIRDVLGKSQWIHVESAGEDKWSREEGAEVVRLLRSLVENEVSLDLYIVTPFVIVAENLRQLIRTSGVLKSILEEKELFKWTNERVGTVHTVQGREAEAVIFVLGAPNPQQGGARGWAGGRPNLLNVAVTRAKEVFYVVGNRALWREAGSFSHLDRNLP